MVNDVLVFVLRDVHNVMEEKTETETDFLTSRTADQRQVWEDLQEDYDGRQKRVKADNLPASEHTPSMFS